MTKYKVHVFAQCTNLNIYLFRGGVMIKKRENFGQCTKKGGGIKTTTKMSEIQIRTFENPWGVSIFQKCLNHKLLSELCFFRKL